MTAVPSSEDRALRPSREGVLDFCLAVSADAERDPIEEPDSIDIAEIETFARSAEAPKELRLIQSRIDAGLYTWADVAEGRVDDPDTRTFFDNLDRSIPYGQLGRWAEHGRAWEDIQAEARRLILGDSDDTNKPLPGVMLTSLPPSPDREEPPGLILR